MYHFVYRLTCTRKEIFSFGLNFLSKLNAHPHDRWIGIINRMNLDVFQYKLLIIPSNQDNHKSLFVVIGLQNVVKHGRRLGNGDHPCILHLESGKRQLNHSLANVTAHNIRLLLNKLYRSHVKAGNDITINPFSSRLMPLRRPKSKKLCHGCLVQQHTLVSTNDCSYVYISVRLSNLDSDAGIGLVRYVHSLIGLAETTISNRDVDDRCQCILAKDKALTTKGSDLNRLRQDVLQLMIVLSQKYLSLRSSKANVYFDPDPFKDDRSMFLEDLSSGSSEHDDDSTWDPGEDEYNNITDNSCGDDNFDNEGDQDDSDRESLHSADRPDQVKTKPKFDHRDVAVLKSTNGLLCPGDILSYRLRTPRGKPKTSTIARLLDPSTPDKKLITLENGVILKPFVHDVKRQKMYGGGACGHLTDPLSVWMKMEQCTLFVGCTSNFVAADKDENHIDTNNGYVTDDSNTTNCVDLDGK